MTTSTAPALRAIAPEELFFLPALCRVMAYVIDAQRVLEELSMKAQHVPALKQQLDRACDTWRNPGCDGELGLSLVTVQTYVAARVDVLAASHDD